MDRRAFFGKAFGGFVAALAAPKASTLLDLKSLRYLAAYGNARAAAQLSSFNANPVASHFLVLEKVSV